jgi:hypothetical protein
MQCRQHICTSDKQCCNQRCPLRLLHSAISAAELSKHLHEALLEESLPTAAQTDFWQQCAVFAAVDNQCLVLRFCNTKHCQNPTGNFCVPRVLLSARAQARGHTCLLARQAVYSTTHMPSNTEQRMGTSPTQAARSTSEHLTL